MELLQQHQQDARLSYEDLGLELGNRFKKLIPFMKASDWWSRVIGELEPKITEAKSIQEILALFPVLTRIDIQQSSQDIQVISQGVTRDQLTHLTTSGSTGKPVTIIRHQKMHQIQHFAAELLDAIWQERDLTSTAAYLRMPLDNDEQQSWGEPFTYLGKTGKAFRRSLVTNTVPAILDFLIEKQVKVFLVNPLVLKFLIKEQRQNPRVNAKFDQVMSWADRVDPELRKQALEVFGAKISDRYSSTEFGFLAITCPHADHLHALQFKNYIEILNSDNNPCKIGEPGRVVVTSLENLAMPLIRYELGDIASFGEPCEHGINLPVLEPKIVRTREVTILPDGTMEIPYLDDTELSQHPNVVDMQAYRFLDGLVVLFESETPIPESILESTRSYLATVFKSSAKIETFRVPSLKFLGFWKRKLVLDVPTSMPEELSVSFFEEVERTKGKE